MKERPILFSAPMVNAILAGTKTMTRRIAKMAPPVPGLQGPNDRALVCGHLYGDPGDRLWVRETHAVENLDGDERVIWRSDFEAAWSSEIGAKFYLPTDYKPKRWTPAIHMRRAFSRIDLEVTAVRAERLQDITEEDARAEGFPLGPTPGILRVTDAATGKVEEHKVITHDFTARGSFCHLWEGINGKRAAWATNPWCWVVSFKVVSK